MSNIKPEMKVRYRADPSIVGWVTAIDGDNARIFIDGSVRLVPCVELEPVPVPTEMSPRDLKNYLTWRRLKHPLTDQLFSYKASRTKLYYHQFLPVKKILESPDHRILIADEVGTGKTIEAGLIWAELESRAANGLENVWIICPKPLVGKWQAEMLRRFDFQLQPLTPDGLRQALVALKRDGVLPYRFAKSIVNLELVRIEKYLTELSEAPISWDFVIFDEAHHLRNPSTLSHALAVLMCERAKAVAFLTATPLQTSSKDIVNLMAALGVDVAVDPRLLEEQMNWDMRLNDWVRIMRHQPPGWEQEAAKLIHELEADGSDRPGWSEFRQLTAGSDLNDRRHRTLVIDSARQLQALSPYMTRTYRADVDENRPTREAITRIVEFTSQEKTFYDKVYEICLERAEREGNPPGFVTQMPERRTASCVPAVASEILDVSEDEDEEHKARFTSEEVEELIPFAKAALTSEDQKLKALYEMLKTFFNNLEADRVMIFSTFRGTLRYLRTKLQERGYSLDLIYGPTPARDEDCRRGERSRERIAAEFRQGKFQILLASEVAGEGLDFEHCHVVINYDLPWNPMRVEQRIGRCDRLGQSSDKVYIGSLASTGTIESRILERLIERLQIFERALGDMEVILGKEITSFRKDIFNRHLTPEQQDTRLDRSRQVIENQLLQQEAVLQSSVISKQGRQLIESDQQEIKKAKARFLSPEDLAEFVYASIERHIPDTMKRTNTPCEFRLLKGRGRLSNELKKLQRGYPQTHYARSEITRFLNRIEQSRNTRVSFAGEVDGVEFAHVRHPLMLLARDLEGLPLSDPPWCSGSLPRGMVDRTTMLVWAIGSLEGYTERAELLCAAVDCTTEETEPIPVERAQELMQALSTGTGGSPETRIEIESMKAKAEKALLYQFDSIKDSFTSRDSLLTEKAKRAVRSYAERKLKWLERQLAREDLDLRLIRMYQGWSRNLEGETQAKLADIEQKSGIRSSLEIIGMAVIQPEAATSTPDERVQPQPEIIPRE